jgi:hypothetical protein
MKSEETARRECIEGLIRETISESVRPQKPEHAALDWPLTKSRPDEVVAGLQYLEDQPTA